MARATLAVRGQARMGKVDAEFDAKGGQIEDCAELACCGSRVGQCMIRDAGSGVSRNTCDTGTCIEIVCARTRRQHLCRSLHYDKGEAVIAHPFILFSMRSLIHPATASAPWFSASQCFLFAVGVTGVPGDAPSLFATACTQDTCPPFSHIRILVLDEQLSILAVAVRLFLRNLDNREDGVAFGENGIHLFEGAIRGFRVEEVDGWDDEGIAVSKSC